jgi:hypothetical protein
MKSSTTPDFWAAYQVLPERVRNLARKNYLLWQENPAHPSLHWKQLRARAVVNPCRVAISRAGACAQWRTAYWFWIGSHNEFDKIIARFISE